MQNSKYVSSTLSYLFNLVLSGLHALDLLLFSCSLILLNLNLILFLKELTFGSLLQVGNLLKLYPVLMETKTYTTMVWYNVQAFGAKSLTVEHLGCSKL